jgi:hypothetical protein
MQFYDFCQYFVAFLLLLYYFYVDFIFCSGKEQKLFNNLFSPPLRYGENAALSGECLVSPSLRCGENKALETDALRAPLSAALAGHYDNQIAQQR